MPQERRPDPPDFPYGPDHGVDELTSADAGWYEDWTPDTFPGTQPEPIPGQLSIDHGIDQCEWFALCVEDAAVVVPHPAFPEGVKVCRACYDSFVKED